MHEKLADIGHATCCEEKLSHDMLLDVHPHHRKTFIIYICVCAVIFFWATHTPLCMIYLQAPPHVERHLSPSLYWGTSPSRINLYIHSCIAGYSSLSTVITFLYELDVYCSVSLPLALLVLELISLNHIQFLSSIVSEAIDLENVWMSW